MRRGGGAPRKDGGGEGGKVMGPLFPRLHVNDTTLKGGGPRAPPRNKMALYEQFSVPSQRFNATANANANATTPHRPAASYAVSSASAGKAKFVCACFGGAIEVSKFSENTMTSLRKKLSKMLRRLAGCLWCNDCTTHVTCCGKHDVYYCGNEGVTRDDGRQGGGSHEGGSQQAVPDLISL